MVDAAKVEYIVEQNAVNPVVKVRVSDKDYLVNPAYLVRYYKEKLYSKEDAQYELFKKRILSGIPMKNYNKSKYYKMYLERAKKENPELFFQ